MMYELLCFTKAVKACLSDWNFLG